MGGRLIMRVDRGIGGFFMGNGDVDACKPLLAQFLQLCPEVGLRRHGHSLINSVNAGCLQPVIMDEW